VRLAAAAPAVTQHVIDVGDRASVAAYASDAERAHGAVDVLINNAGVNSYRTIRDSSHEDFEWVLNTNLWGPIHCVRAFLPLLEARPVAHIVNISSIASFLPLPMTGPYNMAKAGVTALSETLMVELSDSNIGVTCVHPGGVKTNISRRALHTTAQDHALFDRLARTTPEQAAAAIVRAIKRNRRRVLIGADAKLLYALRWLMPRLCLAIVGRQARKLSEQANVPLQQ
jgi:NAD(P)-dependent dehydrogenase (short-subunit alcohol dehydrogenase family)